jgi:hypothetical protein
MNRFEFEYRGSRCIAEKVSGGWRIEVIMQGRPPLSTPTYPDLNQAIDDAKTLAGAVSN